MKVGRNDPCPCGSGKKFKRCCIGKDSQPSSGQSSGGQQSSGIADEISQILAMNPNLTMDELNRVIEQKVAEQNECTVDDFCGLTPTQIDNWMNSHLSELEGVDIQTPVDLSSSPVMRYLRLIMEAIVSEGGSIKTTAKGNLPTKIVKAASALLPEFAVAEQDKDPSISEFAGSNEDKFNALHYTRILADLADIIYYQGGRLYLRPQALQRYKTQGPSAFYLGMLEAASHKFNWSYLDAWPEDIHMQQCWLFMLWRLQHHYSLEQLVEEVCVAFPMLLEQLPDNRHSSKRELLSNMIEVRFLCRFLRFFGMVSVGRSRFDGESFTTPQITPQPLLEQTFHFTV